MPYVRYCFWLMQCYLQVNREHFLFFFFFSLLQTCIDALLRHKEAENLLKPFLVQVEQQA